MSKSYGHVRRIAEKLRLVGGGVIRQRCQTRAARAQVHVDLERIGACLKIHVAVRDPTIEQRAAVALDIEQTVDVETMCLDAPRAAHRRRQPAD